MQLPKRLFSGFFTPMALILVCTASLFSQIKGKITDSKGNPLAYASIYQENTTRGTVSNELGEYEFLPDKKGKIRLNFQYVGFAKKSVSINYQNKLIIQNVKLEEDNQLIEELVVSANREDPAYPIIRNAIKKRTFHKNWIKSYEADLYIKGVLKVLDAPDKIFGQKVEDADGMLDSLGQGIIYLSETRSKFYFKQPDYTKEVVISIKKSGDNSLFTANQFSMVDISLYDNYIEMGRSVLSPIGDVALQYYQYSLVQLDIDEQGRTLYKIRVKPKSTSTPLMDGHIYILGDTWNIHSVDVALSGKALKIPLMDSIQFKQIYLPIASGEWPLFSQTMFFKGNILGFSFGGNFTYIFSNHNLKKDLSEIFNTNETFKVNKDALVQDSLFWADSRPVPLTTEELTDYRKKDSLQKIWTSKTYLDSTDRKSNQFTFRDILMGYSYSNRYKNFRINYPVPLSLVRYNVVEGWNIYFDANYTKRDSLFRNWVINPLLVYGFSDKKLKPSLKISRRFNNEMLGVIAMEFGRRYVQYDEQKPILIRSNTWSSVFYKKNYIRLFGKDFINISYAKELVNGIYINAHLEWAERWPLDKISDFSFFYKSRIYESNQPNNTVTSEAYDRHKISKISINFTWVPGQTYSSYPNIRFRDGGKWPVFNVESHFGLPLDNDTAKPFSTARISISDSKVNFRRIGYSEYHLEWAGSVIEKPTYFADFNHPLSNEWLFPDGNRLNMFFLLPFYRYSTADYYFGAHFKHHFNGLIIDKIPLLNKTPFKMMVSANYLWNPAQKLYFETGVGIENIVVGPIPIGSVEYFWSWSSYLPKDRGFILKLTQLIAN